MFRTRRGVTGGRVSPLGAVARGLAAGVVATAAMTGYQMVVSRIRGESKTRPKAWKDAPAPAQVGKRILTGVFQEKVGLDQAHRLSNAMHWGYGIGWGAVYGLLEGTAEAPAVPAGVAFGTGVWAMSYAQLVPMGIYEPPWKYPAQELALDISYHLTYGIAAALAFRAIAP